MRGPRARERPCGRARRDAPRASGRHYGIQLALYGSQMTFGDIWCALGREPAEIAPRRDVPLRLSTFRWPERIDNTRGDRCGSNRHFWPLGHFRRSDQIQ